MSCSVMTAKSPVSNPVSMPTTASVTSLRGVACTVRQAPTLTMLCSAWSFSTCAMRSREPSLHSATVTWIVASTPLGAETTAPAAAPARLQIVPGAVLGDGRAAVRVAVPGAEGAVVRVSILGRDGLVPATGESVLSVGAGSVGELPLEGVPAGIIVGYHPIADATGPRSDREALDEAVRVFIDTVRSSPGNQVEATVEAVNADERTARILGLKEGAAILTRETLVRDAAGVPQFLAYGHYRGDRVALWAEDPEVAAMRFTAAPSPAN